MYQWHQKEWHDLLQRKARLPHAILLKGKAGIGKHVFALSLAKALLCKQAQGDQPACGQCPSCQWFEEGTHPDYRWLTPEEDTSSSKKSSRNKPITVAQVRQLFDYLSLSNHQVDGYRIILVSPAEALNIASANALLKMLEEPPVNTLFILVASQPQQLLPTIRSRCQAIDLPTPSTAQSIAWLNEQGAETPEAALHYAGGAPLAAVEMQAILGKNNQFLSQLAMGRQLSPNIAAAGALGTLDMLNTINALQKWVYDLLQMHLMQGIRYHSTHAKALQTLSKRVNLRLLLRFQKDLTEAKKSANHPLSNEMQLENILVQYTHLFDV